MDYCFYFSWKPTWSLPSWRGRAGAATPYPRVTGSATCLVLTTWPRSSSTFAWLSSLDPDTWRGSLSSYGFSSIRWISMLAIWLWYKLHTNGGWKERSLLCVNFQRFSFKCVLFFNIIQAASICLIVLFKYRSVNKS